VDHCSSSSPMRPLACVPNVLHTVHTCRKKLRAKLLRTAWAKAPSIFALTKRVAIGLLLGSGSVLSGVSWSCGGLEAPDEDQSDEESSEPFHRLLPQGDVSDRAVSVSRKIHRLLPQGDVQTGLFPYREKSIDCSPRVTFRPGCFRIEKNPSIAPPG
jgi:hypothetical protein